MQMLNDARAVSAWLLAAHSRGLAGYRRTPEVLRTSGGFEGLGISSEERFVAPDPSGLTRAKSKQPPDRLC